MRRFTRPRMQTFATVIVIAVTPAYLGLLQATVLHMLVYSAIAATVLATGDYLDHRPPPGTNRWLFVQEMFLWWLVLIGLGGPAYAVARGVGHWVTAWQ